MQKRNSKGVTGKSRLLVLASTYPRWQGDPEPAFVHELCKSLLHCFDVTVLCPHASGAPFDEVMEGVRVVRYRYAPERFETLVNDGGIVSNLKGAPWKWLLLPLFFVAQIWGLWRINRTWKPDLIHAHWLIPQALSVTFLGVLTSRLPPLYVTSHGADLFALKSKVFQWLKRLVVARASGVSVVSSIMKQELEDLGCDATKISVMPMGVDLEDRFSPSRTVVRSRREILFVGRLVEKKGLRYLLEALPSVLEVFPDTSITVVGFGPEKTKLLQLVDALKVQNRVSFVGAVPQSGLAEYYRRAAVFVAPFILAQNGDQEGLGLVVVEALGCGCPVIVSDIPATRDITHDIEGATTVPMRNSSAIAEAIISVYRTNDRPRPEAVTSISELRRRFSWSSVGNSYAIELSKLLRIGG